MIPGVLNLRLHYKQGLILLSEGNEIGYGGAAGGGKSHGARTVGTTLAFEIPGLQIYLFRRQHNELVKNHMEGPTGFPAILQPWIKSGFVQVIKDQIRFSHGSKIFLCHCQHEKDVFNWLGPEMHVVIIEQAEQFTPFMIQMLRGRNRVPEALNIPEKYKHKIPFCLYTFNPGGVGHQFFKQKFVKGLKRSGDGVSEIVQQPDHEGGKRRQFIQAKLDDNPSVNPVEYRKTLRGLPPRMAKALEEGDFDQVIGAYFPEINRATHLVQRHALPEWWPRICALDWGACGEGDPFSIGWYAIADNSLPPYRRNDMICYRRWNGAGLPKITATQIAREMLKREAKDPAIVDRIAGGDITQEKGGAGPSVFETFANEGVNFRRADDRRLAGAIEFRERLVGREDRPAIYWFDECEDDIETISSLQHDLHNPNEIAPGDDHDYDRNRYAVMSRAGYQDKPAEEKTLEEHFPKPTMNDLWAMNESRQRR